MQTQHHTKDLRSAPSAGAAAEVPALSVGSVSIHFGGIKALTDVSFDAPPNEVTAVIGPNGAGKTTLFNCISGIYRGEGSVFLDGERLDRLSASERAQRGLARTFQTPALIDEISVLENVLLGCYSWTRAGIVGSFLGLRPVRREEAEARAVGRDMLERLELGAIAGSSVGGLPHRQRRLVEIARALVSRPRVLLLDEPAAGSHHNEASETLALVTAVTKEHGIAMVLVEHNVPLVMEYAQNVVVLDFGKVIAHGAPAVVQSEAAVIEAYLGQPTA